MESSFGGIVRSKISTFLANKKKKNDNLSSEREKKMLDTCVKTKRIQLY